MSGVIWVAPEDGERAVDLFEQDDAGQFMSEGHLAEGNDVLSRDFGFLTEAVRCAYGKDERQGIAVLIIS